MADIMAIDSMEPALMEGAISLDTEMPVAAVAAAPKGAGRMFEVEVKRWHGAANSRTFGWQRMPIKEALRLQDETFRCPECLGRVRLKYASVEKDTADRAEHYSKNVGCSLGDCFDGEKRQHPKPIN